MAVELSKIRFIPTLVGNTYIGQEGETESPVHPHARGEHGCAGFNHLFRGGSSPRSWGTLYEGRQLSRLYRFIPTLVGNTRTISTEPSGISVHPHARGEHEPNPSHTSSPYGSSPRSWGTRRCIFKNLPRSRFIPTLVGNTTHPPSCLEYVTVHPHARGEHGSGRSAVRHNRGSSPRSWGTPTVICFIFLVLRFIPTLVGNTACRNTIGAGPSVHPHARGEHYFGRVAQGSGPGSSPRSWGTPNHHPHVCCR